MARKKPKIDLIWVINWKENESLPAPVHGALILADWQEYGLELLRGGTDACGNVRWGGYISGPGKAVGEFMHNNGPLSRWAWLKEPK